MLLQAGVPYLSPIAPESFGMLAVLLLVVGLIATAAFIVNPLAGPKASSAQRITTEAIIATVASGFLGFGSLFLFLWAGIYV